MEVRVSSTLTGSWKDRLNQLLRWLLKDISVLILEYESLWVEPEFVKALQELDASCRTHGDMASAWKPTKTWDGQGNMTQSFTDMLSQGPSALLSLLGVRPRAGLTTAEAQRRLAIVGRNVDRVPLTGWVNNASVSEELQEIYDAWTPRVQCLRDGMWAMIPWSCVVSGDIVIVREGFKCMADVRMLATRELFVSMILYTGEHECVKRTVDCKAPSNSGWFQPENVVYSGCLVVQGEGLAVVYATAEDLLISSFVFYEDEMTDIEKVWSRKGLEQELLLLAKEHGIMARSKITKAACEAFLESKLLMAELPTIPDSDVLTYALQHYDRIVLRIPQSEVKRIFGEVDESKSAKTSHEALHCYVDQRIHGNLSSKELLKLIRPHAVTVIPREQNRAHLLIHRLEAQRPTFFESWDELGVRTPTRTAMTICNGSVANDRMLSHCAFVAHGVKGPPHCLRWLEPFRDSLWRLQQKLPSKCLVQ